MGHRASTSAGQPPPPPPSFSPSGKKLGFTIDNGKLHNVSLGQGQEVVAENALDVAAENGHWVILQVPRGRPRGSGAPTPRSAMSRPAGRPGVSGPLGDSAGSSDVGKTPGWTPENPEGVLP